MDDMMNIGWRDLSQKFPNVRLVSTRDRQATTVVAIPIDQKNSARPSIWAHELEGKPDIETASRLFPNVVLQTDGQFYLPVSVGTTPEELLRAGARFGASLARMDRCQLDLRKFQSEQAANSDFCWFVRGVVLGRYSQTLDGRNDDAFSLDIICDVENAETGEWQTVLHGIHGELLMRDLVNMPPNILTPGHFARICKSLEAIGLDVEILDKATLEEEGFGCLLAVAQGSTEPPFVAILSHRGGGAEPPTVLAGKGVCFDSGGLSLKPAEGMMSMKTDMAGAAAVVGAICTMALTKAKKNVVAIVGLTENMPGGSAVRPGDVVQAHDGRLVEVLNTDYEGRLVLADIMSFARDRYAPSSIVSIGTLTGGVIMALGGAYAGAFSNSERLLQLAVETGSRAAEPVWPLPVNERFDGELASDVADLRNIGRTRGAAASVCARFLQGFVEPVPWLHFDIAGVTSVTDQSTIPGKGANGFGARLFCELITSGL
ncbi:leucyl aminopeptidase family protein [Rhizobium leguminosarum]|uniref:leucyl aminopeptidase family protein n=1 Tax=Rhizobium leguminosarum TaxID=384 RepID=UPI001C957E9A|nr:M17 family metallopeptidase [Rhizobium leguminosarum]MBY5361915.1 leucyl aminopeptidase [Rhizobium leguminosarum]MBY5664945.1 leucyl aminopeptidase [Rhizobium leguminosarum]MBY5677571.1 leucyl aminopeptidase [Rhizobium leguminosarum]